MRRVQISGAAGRRFVGVLAVEPKPRAGAHRWNVLGFPLILGVVLHAAPTSGSFLCPSVCQSAFALRGSPVNNTALTQAERTMRATTMTVMGIAASAVVHTTSGAELAVPSKQYPTIQAAIDGASDGDTIVIAPGTFTETTQVDNKAIAFRGAGANQTTWRAPAGARCLWAMQTSNKAISVSDIRFADFSMPYNAAAVDLEAVAPHQVQRCQFTNCAYFALEVYGGGSLVEDCEFVGTVEGSAVSTNAGLLGAPHVFRNCVFRDNIFQNAWYVKAAAMDIYESNVRLENCSFQRNNYPIGNGIAIRVVAANLAVFNTEFCESSTSPISGGWTDGGGNTLTTASCAPACPTDIVHDGVTNAADMAVLLNFWNTDGSQYPGVDLNNDGVVDAGDIAVLLNAWGQCAQ